MKPTSLAGHRLAVTLAALLLMGMHLVSCSKGDIAPRKKASTYAAAVIDDWITMQLRLMRNTPGISNQGFSRPFAYAGIAAFEALQPGLNGSYKWVERWNGLTGLPAVIRSKRYYLPASVNAALAAVNKALFPSATVADKAAIDSLENALQASYIATEGSEVVTLSAAFGKAVAAAVISWAAGDGASQANAPYTVPMGPGLWQPTAPQFSAPATPYWGAIRPVVQGSLEGTQPPAPVAYADTPGTPFFQMVKAVYDASQQLTEDQKAMAIFWRDVPGQTSPGHWLYILRSTLRQHQTALDKAAVAYALTGSALNDALIACFAAKYQYNLVRPITFIRDIMGHSNWTPFIGTPAHPEYPSAHAALSGAAAGVLQTLFGNNGPITDHTYDYMGLAPRTYASFTAIGEEAGRSRLYAGIHYPQSIDAGLEQGRKVTQNILDHNR